MCWSVTPCNCYFVEFFPNILWLLYAFPNVKVLCTCRAGRYEVDGYVYNAADEPKILMTGKLNEALSYQVCDLEGEPLPGTEMKEVGCLIFVTFIPFFVFLFVKGCIYPNNYILFLNCLILQVWRVADVPKNDKFQYTHFAHKINSFDTAPKKLLASDSRLRPDRMALERGDLSTSGHEKSK